MTPDDVAVFARLKWNANRLARMADVSYAHARKALAYEPVPDESEAKIRLLAAEIEEAERRISIGRSVELSQDVARRLLG